jgi:hypothetical protein
MSLHQGSKANILKDGSSSDYVSALSGLDSVGNAGATGDASDKQSDTTAKGGQSRSTMASRWAFDDSKIVQDMKAKNKAAASSAPKTWLKQRDDLFSGHAKVTNASPDVFATLPQRDNRQKKAKEGNSASENKTRGGQSSTGDKKISARVSSPISAGDNVGGNRSRPRTKAALLTGANLSAMGGDNGWAERSSKAFMMDRFAVDGMINRDVPPHLNAAKEPTISPLEARDYMRGGYDLSNENEVQALIKAEYSSEPPVKQSQAQGLQYNQDLLESIARMEQRNMLSRPALAAMTPNSLIEDPHRGRHAAPHWQ